MTTIRVMTLQLVVRVPASTSEWTVSCAINAALDEPPCDWEDWEVGAASVIGVQHVAEDEEG